MINIKIVTEMASRKEVSIALALLLLSLSAFGQRFNFRNYSLENGLAQSQLYCVFQDNQGYLWCATSGGGVSRFDGINFVNFGKKDGLADNIVFFITQDRRGDLWIGTDKGAARYDGRRFTNYTKADGLNDDSIWTIVEDKQGHLWFGTYNGGASRFDGKNFTNYTQEDGLCNNRVFSIIQDRENHFWFGTFKGVSRFDGSAFVNYTKQDGLADDNVRCILEDREGALWFATKGGVNKYDGKTFTRYTTGDGLADNIVNFVIEDRDGHLWFATEKGVSEYDGAVFTTYTSKNGLGYDFVESMCQDREGNLWFATDLGLSRYSGKMFASLTTADGLPDDTIWGIWQDRGGAIWLSTEKGVFKYFEQDARVVPVGEIPAGRSAFPFFEDGRGNLWFGVANSVYKYDGRAFTKAAGEELFGEHDVFSIYQDKSGDMWFGTQEGGVIRYTGKGAVTFTMKEGLADNNVNAIIEDKFGNMWFGTDGGVSIYDGKTFKNIAPKNGLNTRYTLCIIPDREENLWVGSYGGGVMKVSPAEEPGIGSVEIFTSADGLSDDEVLLLAFDERGFLYIGTNKGLNRLDVQAFNDSGKKSFRHYGKSEGFVGIECQQNAVFKDREGNLWFGTVRGAIKYSPEEERLNVNEPQTSITNLKLFLEEKDLSAFSDGIDRSSGLPLDLALPHTKNHLTFEYIGICLCAPEKVMYRVCLEGFEENWSPLTQATYVTYSNLPPRHYTFKVKACNNSGIWNEQPRSYRFRIIAPFWQRWWFILACFMAVSLGIFGYIKLRIRHLQQRRRALEKKVHERTVELKREQAKVEAINLELEARVKERTEKLVKAKEQLLQAQKMEAIGTLASSVAHDLNNVLAGIVTVPEFLLEEAPGHDSTRPYLHKIQKAGERAAAVVQDLLTLARRGASVTEPVNLSEVVAEYLKSPEFEKLAADHPGLQVETHLDNRLHPIMASPAHISKTVMNLVANAAEAMHDGGKITISTQERTVAEPLHGYETIQPGEYVLLSVSDSGVGISAEDMGRIFEPFYTRKHMGLSGSGLGLTVVWNTVRDHHGSIDVRSSRGQGTTISLYFPRGEQEVNMKESAPAKKDYLGKGESVLVVDDEPDQRELASLILTRLGYRPITAASGEEAVEYVKKHEVDLVMLDMLMEPGIDGSETYKRIAAIRPGQRAIIVSGFSVDDRVKAAQRLGAGAFVQKPYLMKEIGRAIKKELDN